MHSVGYESLTLLGPTDGVLEIQLDRRGSRNAVDGGMHAELTRVWAEVDDDPEVGVVVLSGAGDSFCAGGDLDYLDACLGDVEAVLEVRRSAWKLARRLIELETPVVAAVQGDAVGVGLALVLLSDITVVAEDARLCDGHTRLGVTAGDHAALIWPLLCGMAKAKYYLLTAEFLDGREAERIGLVTEALPADRVLGRAHEVAARLAAGSPEALRGTKRTLNHWLRAAYPAFDASLASEMLCMLSPDSRRRLDRLRTTMADPAGGAGAGS